MNRAYTQPVSALEPGDIESILKLSLEEDSPSGDVTSESIFSPQETCKARIVARENGILSGSLAFQVFARLTNHSFKYELIKNECDHFVRGDVIAVMEGNLISVLKIERPLLNFLQYLSGIATETGKLVSRYPSLKIFDTRKTLPGYRKAVKYAVHCGGGWNHRLNLSEMAMLKDNHVARAESITKAVEIIKKKHAVLVEAEIDGLGQLPDALESGAEIILLDNFSVEDIKTAVTLIRKTAPDTKIEVSGGITPEKLEQLSQLDGLGVSMGYLTHTTRFIDLSLEIS